MRILYVGNGNLKHRGARYYDPGRKILNGLIRNGHNVYFMSDRDTARSGSLFSTRKLGVGYCNRVFVDTCANFQPDMIVFGHADIITTASLEAAKNVLPNVMMVQFNVDPVFRPHNISMIRSKLPYMDATFVTTAGPILKLFQRNGAVVAHIPNAVDASIDRLRCYEHTDQPHDVFWARRASNFIDKNDPRTNIPLFLENSGKVDIDYYGMNGKPEIMSAHYFNALGKSKMGLNISAATTTERPEPAAEEELYLYSSDRIAHYMGNGLLTFATRGNHLEELFDEDKELIFFGGQEELLNKVVYYKKNEGERQKIAEAGWKKYHACYNEKLIAKFIVETALGQTLSENYAWPTETY